MALRSLLRRIPVLLPPSGPRMGPVHGISPAAAARFMKTGSQVEAEQESIRVYEQNKSDNDFAQLEEEAEQHLAELSRATEKLRKVGNASAVVLAAIPVIMIIGSNYQA